MRRGLAGWMIGLCTLPMGCQLAENAFVNCTHEAKQASTEIHEQHQYRELAKGYLEQFRENTAEKLLSHDFEKGFVYGFADYLTFGATVQSPTVPPRHYWASRYHTAEGHGAIGEWYDGFHHGAAAAKGSGYRQRITMLAQRGGSQEDILSAAAPGEVAKRSALANPPCFTQMDATTTTKRSAPANLPYPMQMMNVTTTPDSSSPSRDRPAETQAPVRPPPTLLPPVEVNTDTGTEKALPHALPRRAVTFVDPRS